MLNEVKSLFTNRNVYTNEGKLHNKNVVIPLNDVQLQDFAVWDLFYNIFSNTVLQYI